MNVRRDPVRSDRMCQLQVPRIKEIFAARRQWWRTITSIGAVLGDWSQDIEAVYVYGSFARNEATFVRRGSNIEPISDLDIFLEVKGKESLDWVECKRIILDRLPIGPKVNPLFHIGLKARTREQIRKDKLVFHWESLRLDGTSLYRAANSATISGNKEFAETQISESIVDAFETLFWFTYIYFARWSLDDENSLIPQYVLAKGIGTALQICGIALGAQSASWDSCLRTIKAQESLFWSNNLSANEKLELETLVERRLYGIPLSTRDRFIEITTSFQDLAASMMERRTGSQLVWGQQLDISRRLLCDVLFRAKQEKMDHSGVLTQYIKERLKRFPHEKVEHRELYTEFINEK